MAVAPYLGLFFLKKKWPDVRGIEFYRTVHLMKEYRVYVDYM